MTEISTRMSLTASARTAFALSFPALVLALAPIAKAGEWEADFETSAELRWFPESPLLPGQLEDVQPSLVVQGEFQWQSENGKHEFVFVPWARLDGEDDQRSHADFREAFYRYYSDDDWSLLIGAGKVFWGTTESRHLVDIVNQTDGVEDIDEEDKLGQPMINLGFSKDWGQLDFYLLPFFRDRTFPGEEGRLRFPVVVQEEDAIFGRSAGREGVDIAARYAHYIGDWDFGISLFHGLSREPRVVVPVTGASEGKAYALYDEITQAGLDLQWTKGAWLWKFEGIVREGQGETFAAAAGGVEYTLYQIGGKDWDLGLLAEYLHDGRDEQTVILPGNVTPKGPGVTTAAPVTTFEDDLFTGARLAFNDSQDTSILAGAITDLEDGTVLGTIEAGRRFGENWVGEVESRFVTNADPANALTALDRDDFVTLRITRYY